MTSPNMAIVRDKMRFHKRRGDAAVEDSQKMLKASKSSHLVLEHLDLQKSKLVFSSNLPGRIQRAKQRKPLCRWEDRDSNANQELTM